MALLSGFQSKMIYWDILVAGESVREHIRETVTGISINYELSKLTKGSITFSSQNLRESYIRSGAPVEVRFGYSPVNLVSMISGTVLVDPRGSASASVSYTATINNNTKTLNKVHKNRSFGSHNTKNKIIAFVADVADYDYIMSIADGNTRIPKNEQPKQTGQTDLYFLIECAERWNCIVWIVDNTIYFVDSDQAHGYGNLNRTLHPQDLSTDYLLKYNTRYLDNNVKSVSWGRKKGTTTGSPKAAGASREGPVISSEDFDIEHFGQTWTLKAEVQKRLKGNMPLYRTIFGVIYDVENKRVEDGLFKKYFVPKNKGKGTHKNETSSASHKGSSLIVNAELYKGDPYLRPPRKGLFECGDGEGISTELPRYLFRDSPEYKQKYNINKVNTSLTAGFLQTKLEMTMGLK